VTTLWPNGELVSFASENVTISADEVQVWSASLELGSRSISSLQHILSGDEIDRAKRYRFARERRRFVAARGLLRLILGRYSGTPPERLRFCYGQRGKPSLASEPGKSDLEFSVSHSSDLALYAVARGRQVGIDLERIRPLPELQALVERCCSSAEQAAFRALPTEEQLLAFFRCWTRKEAFLKAKGQGLSCALDRFEVSMAADEPAMLLRVDGDPREASGWSLHELSPGQGYVGAVAVEGHCSQLSCWAWKE
jgi:4'-phosphopantetheinyl transferase